MIYVDWIISFFIYNASRIIENWIYILIPTIIASVIIYKILKSRFESIKEMNIQYSLHNNDQRQYLNLLKDEKNRIEADARRQIEELERQNENLSNAIAKLLGAIQEGDGAKTFHQFEKIY